MFKELLLGGRIFLNGEDLKSLKIINDYFDEFSNHKYDLIAKKMNCDKELIFETVEKVSVLNPVPAVNYSTEVVNHIVPDIIINCSSAGLKGDEVILPEGLFDKDEICYDLSYSLEETPFNLLAKQHRVQKVYDGKGMLINQAALSFKIWTGKTPEIPEEQEIFT